MTLSTELASESCSEGGGSPDTVRAAVRRDAFVVVAGNVVTGVSNYGFTLAVLWLLPPRGFSEVASVTALLLVAGTAAQAGIPWLVAREVVRRPFGDARRRQAVSFAMTVALGAALIVDWAVYGLSVGYASPGVQLETSFTIVGVFLAQVGAGYLQGSGRFGAYATLMAGEAMARLAVGAGLAGLGAGPTGAMLGATVGAGAAGAAGIWIVRRELVRPARVERELWHQLVGLSAVQVGVAVVSTLDVLVASVLHGVSRPLAGYQAMLVFTRVPVFISGALSTVAYPRLAGGGHHDGGLVVRDLAKVLLITTAALVAVSSTVPQGMLAAVLPGPYLHESQLLLPLAIAGAACGQLNFSSTLLQARGAFMVASLAFVVGVPLAAGAIAVSSASMVRLAWSAASADVVLAVVFVLLSRRCVGRRCSPGIAGIVTVTGTAGLVAVFRDVLASTSAWLVAAAALAVLTASIARWGLFRAPVASVTGSRLPVRALRVHRGLHSRSDRMTREATWGEV